VTTAATTAVGTAAPSVRPRRVLVVDNYDSFVFNLVQYLAQLGAECTVVRNDAVDLGAVPTYDGVLLSPGPGTPDEVGGCVALL
jgi:para-aminobenzoate synthetase component II